MRRASCPGYSWGNPIAPTCRMQSWNIPGAGLPAPLTALRQDPTALPSRSYTCEVETLTIAVTSPAFFGKQSGTAFANTYMECIGLLDAANRNAAGHNAAMPVRGRSGLCNGSN